LQTATGDGALIDRASGRRVLLYEQQEGRGIGLMAKLQAYGLQDQGLDTVQATKNSALKPIIGSSSSGGSLESVGLEAGAAALNNPQKVSRSSRRELKW